MTLGRRRLGSQGLEVGAIGLACMGMSQSCVAAGRVSGNRNSDFVLATIDR